MTDSSPAGGTSETVDVYIHLLADRSNGGTTKQIMDEMKKIKEAAAAHQNGAGDGIAKGMSSAWDKAASANERANERMKAGFARLAADHRSTQDKMAAAEQKRNAAAEKDASRAAAAAERESKRASAAQLKADRDIELSANRVAKNRIAMLARIAQHEKQKVQEAKQAESAEASRERLLLRSEVRQESMIHKGIHGFGSLAGSVGSVTKGFMLMGTSSEESMEQMAKSFVKVEAAFEVLHGGLHLFLGINDALLTMKRYAAAAAAEHRLLAAAEGASAAAHAASGAAGAGGSIAGGMGGAAALYAKGMLSGMGGAASIAGGVAVTAVSAVAIHDVMAKILFGYEGLLSSVLDWKATTERNVEHEKAIERMRESQKRAVEELAQRQEKQRKRFEAAERIEDTHRSRHEANEAAARSAAYDSRIAGTSSGPLTEHQVRMAKLRDAEALSDIQNESADEKLARLRGEYGESAAAAARTKSDTDKSRGRVSVRMPSEAESQAAAPGGFMHGLGRGFTNILDTLAGNNWTASDRRILARSREDETARQMKGQPTAEPVPLDLEPQLEAQEKMLKRANELRDAEAQRAAELVRQKEQIHEQVRASQELLASTREQVKAEKERVDSVKAGLSMMTKGEQAVAAGILKKMRTTGHVGRSEALYLKKHGIMHGRIGKSVESRLAEDLDKNLASEFQLGGGNEDLDKVKTREADARAKLDRDERHLQQSRKDAEAGISRWQRAGKDATQAQTDVEKTKAEMGGYQEPGTAGEKLGGHVDTASRSWNASIESLENAVATKIKECDDKIRAAVQRIKGMHLN